MFQGEINPRALKILQYQH
uniref:Uncharacterized protein n=1 Tax=Anguilla anguilla TaxID=7936 RepID=A0A0E9SZF1_ANGAN